MSTTIGRPGISRGQAGGTGTGIRTHEFVPVDLSQHANGIAMTSLQTLDAGDLNIWGNSLPVGTLPAEGVTVDGVPFLPLPADGRRADNVRCEGQWVPLPEIRAQWIHLLAASERRCEECVHVHYASGAADPEWLRVSDFWPARPHFGEALAAHATMHYPHHRQHNLSGQVWAVRVPAARREPLAGLRLPENPAVHVFAVTLESVK